jgi:transposase
MGKSVLYVGLDVHKMSMDVAIAEPGTAGQTRYYGRIGGDLEALDRVTRKLKAQGAELRFAYEAGPCGYQVYRHLTAQGHSCLVAAPALIPRRPGDRLKNDRRDALTLARLFRAGELTPVKVPDADDEAMRDLSRAREDAISVERRAKQRTGALLLRHGRRYPGKTTWGRGHWRWLLQQVMEHPAQQIVLQEYLDAVREASARVQRLTGQIRELIPQWRRGPLVAAYQALRGVSLIVAVTVVAEVGDLSRFNNPKELMAYLGLVPSPAPAPRGLAGDHPAARLEGAIAPVCPVSTPPGPGQGQANHCHRHRPGTGGIYLGYRPGRGARNCLKEK